MFDMIYPFCVCIITLFRYLFCLFNSSPVAPHIMPFELDDSVFSGESVQLICQISKGDTPIDISWNFHGQEMSTHLGITTTKLGDRMSVLSLSPIMGSHSGNYTCIAKNIAGMSTYTAAVRVIGIISQYDNH